MVGQNGGGGRGRGLLMRERESGGVVEIFDDILGRGSKLFH